MWGKPTSFVLCFILYCLITNSQAMKSFLFPSCCLHFLSLCAFGVNYLKWALTFKEFYVCCKIFLTQTHALNIYQKWNGFAVLLPACDDECTGLLLNDLDRLNQMIMSVNLTGPLPAPYKLLYSFENTTQELKVCMHLYTKVTYSHTQIIMLQYNCT